MNDEPSWWLDDTLEDALGEAAVEWPADAKQRQALADQRVVHAWLRTLHTADAAHREARIQRILERLPARPARRSPGLVAAALAALVVAAALWAWRTPSPLPLVEAMVDRTLAAMSQPIDRSYTVDVSWVGANGQERRANYALTMRDRWRFRLSGQGLLGPIEAGCDGKVLWVAPGVAWLRWSRPWSHATRLGALLGDGRLDAGDIDLHGLLQRLRERSATLTVARIGSGAGSKVRIEAQGLAWASAGARSVVVVLDEATSELRRVELTILAMSGREKRVVLEARGVVQLEASAYGRPW